MQTFLYLCIDFMKTRFSVICFCLLLALCARAETIVLRTGAHVKGEIVFQNEEVVIIRDASGARSQYPRTDIEQIIANEQSAAAVPQEKPKEQEATKKSVSVLLELAGGAAVSPNDTVGGAFSVDLLVGSHRLAGRHLFVGAGLGYHGCFLGGEKYNFLPVQVAVRMPFVEQHHAPVFGVAVGYGIALSKVYRGGLYADVDLGYRCQLNERTALSLVTYAQFQQAVVPTVQILDGVAFTNNIGRSLVSVGLKLALWF